MKTKIYHTKSLIRITFFQYYARGPITHLFSQFLVIFVGNFSMYSIDIKKFDETSFFNSWVQTHAPQKFAITKPSGWASGVHIFSYTVFRNISPQKSKRYLKSQICEFMSKMHLYPKINNLTKKKKKKKKK